jgi:hypothetical protein
MNWKGDSSLSKWFALVVFFWGLIVGEILPVSIQGMEQGHPGAKQALFADLGNALATLIVYFLLGWIFWFLYRRFHWLLVVIFGALLGAVMEFSFMRPQEEIGPNVVEDPLEALLFFLVIWPILLGTPYALYKIYRKLVERRPLLKPFLLAAASVAVATSFAYAYFFQI